MYSHDDDWCINADKIIKGGTGYDLQNKLPYEIEHQYPDYDLYGVKDKAYGFLTRGCPRNCPFCIVSEKEGRKSHTVAELGEFWNGQSEIMLMDSNITASKNCTKHFEELIKSKARINFEGGVDIRFVTDEMCDQFNRMKIKLVHFAWDNYEFETYEKLKRCRPLLDYEMWYLRVYVLTNYNTTMEQDLERIYKLRELGYDPFVMIYDKPKATQKQRHIQRWVNNKLIFRSCERFEDYINK